ncbi:putative TIR domain, P-loop containing nucleoside triphosphate hydrolase [Helianthus anomalus]
MASSSLAAAASSSPSCKYDVFVSFKGEDIRKTFVDHLYSSLKQHLVSIYEDDEIPPFGKSIHLSLFKAIEESQIAVIIFSKNYAHSPWCLEELAHIMKCKEERELIVLPVFYDVDPSDVRKQKGDFGKAFAQHEIKNNNKAQLWRNALVDACRISGWDRKYTANGHESKLIKEIVEAILNKLSTLNSDVDEDLVGMTTRLQDLKSRLEIGSGGVRMVGIWGIGGSGKTTLATSVYMELCHHFQGHYLMENVREGSNIFGLKLLQETMLSAVSEREVKVYNVAQGKQMIKAKLCKRNVLIVLDDVSDLKQLDVLAGSRNWFGNGSRIIITTRDEHLLKTHKVDHIYRVPLLSDNEAIRLFKRHAYYKEDPIEDYYETLSLQVVSYAAGLPLTLKVIGSFLYGKNKNEWISALAKLKDIPFMEILKIHKISYDGLSNVDKELFLDIACFWRGKSIDDVLEILEACHFHPNIGIRILIEKALISIVDRRFDMHNQVQEMGHYIVRGEHPNNPEKHSRVWNKEDIRDMCSSDATENNNIEAVKYDGYSYKHGHSSQFCKIVSNMKKLRWLKVIMEDEEIEEVECDGGPSSLSNLLFYIDWEGYPASPFPDSFQLTKLVVLKLDTSKQRHVWMGYKHLPRLKVLELRHMNKLLSTPDFNGLPCLQKLIVCDCDVLEEIHPSLGNHTSLEYVRISRCPKLKRFPVVAYMPNLKTLKIENCGLKEGDIPYGAHELSNLQELDLSMNDFSRLDFSFLQVTRLVVLNLSWCNNLIEMPELPTSLAILKADYCSLLTTVEDCFRNGSRLCQVSLMGGSIINDGGSLLQSMLQEEGNENRSMLLQLRGAEIPNEFTPPLLRGSKCTLQLPENWSNDFCGFLMCAVFSYDFHKSDSIRISMIEEMGKMDSEDDVVWEESNSDKSTWVWYVPFCSLRHTTWWNQTYKAVSLNIKDNRCSGFRTRLVDKRRRGGQEFNDTPNIKIEHDSTSHLVICP